jgi:hypothetical protein
MKLSDTVNMGAPPWLDSAFLYVSQHGDTVTPDLEFKGYTIEFSTENLFGEDIKATDAIMRAFEICQVGKEEHPDVVLNFVVRVPYTKKRWEWLGEFQGDEVWMRFTPGVVGLPEKEDDGTLLDDGENDLDPDNETEGDDPVLDAPIEIEYEEPKGKKSGPKDLAAFHANEVAKEEAKGPRGFTKPLHGGEDF